MNQRHYLKVSSNRHTKKKHAYIELLHPHHKCTQEKVYICTSNICTYGVTKSVSVTCSATSCNNIMKFLVDLSTQKASWLCWDQIYTQTMYTRLPETLSVQLYKLNELTYLNTNKEWPVSWFHKASISSWWQEDPVRLFSKASCYQAPDAETHEQGVSRGGVTGRPGK